MADIKLLYQKYGNVYLMLKVIGIIFSLIILLGLVGYGYSAYNKHSDTVKVDQITYGNQKEAIPSPQVVNSPAPQKTTDSKTSNWKVYEDEQVRIEYPESWNIRQGSGKIGKIKVVSIHDPSTMKWEVTHTQQSGAENPTKFVNFNSYDTGSNEIYQTVDKYLDYSSHFYDGRGAKEKYSSNGVEYGFYLIGNNQADFIIIANGKSVTGAIAKETFETLVAEGFNTKNEEIGIIKSVRLK